MKNMKIQGVYKKLLMSCVLALTGLASVGAQAMTRAQEVGDMILDVNVAESPHGVTQSNSFRGFNTYRADPWENGILPVVFDSGVSGTQKQIFFEACDIWSQRVNVKCVNATNEQKTFLVKIRDPGSNLIGCYSTVGKSRFHNTYMNLDPQYNCWNRGTIIHELGHAFGLVHEHQRPDRDQYVDIHWENIPSNLSHNFDLFTNDTVGADEPYDFLSIMHYNQYMYSTNQQPTVTPKPQYAAYANRMGYTTTPSDGDYHSLSKTYGVAQNPTSGTFSLTLVDSVTRAPVKNAVLKLGDHYGQTDEQGRVSITLPFGVYDAQVTRQGYTTVAQAGFAFGGSMSLTHALQPVAPANQDIYITVVVKSARTHEAVEGAIIKLGNYTKTSNADGRVLFIIPKGNYVGSITHPDYASVSAPVSLQQDAGFELELY